MDSRRTRFLAFGVGALISLMAGCGQYAAPLSTSLAGRACLDCDPPAIEHPKGSGTVFELTPSHWGKVLHRFGGSQDGATPYAGLVEVNGTLYGTTESGGANGAGSVYAISASGAESVIHSFGGSGDGANPVATLVNVKGTLYGTTEYGGAYNFGTVFSITTSGIETVLHSFNDSNNDGAIPAGALLDVNGRLYGTTQAGGSGSCTGFFGTHSQVYGCGSVFKITTSGSEKLIYSFDGMFGWRPYGSLIDVNGTLYGTTVWLPGPQGYGSVFTITTSGKETELYVFNPAIRGASPFAGLIDVGGTLYGTTYYGGSGYACGTKGCGVVYSLTPSGRQKVLHTFGASPGDGKHPYANLIDVGGTLYGTTYAGGVTGRGTVFSITTSGSEKVIQSFGRAQGGGKYPSGALIDVKGELFGTTQYGGAN